MEAGFKKEPFEEVVQPERKRHDKFFSKFQFELKEGNI